MAITKYCTHLHHTLAALKRYFPPHSLHPRPAKNKQISLPQIILTPKSTPKHIHHHYAPSVTSTHTTHIISSTAPTYAPHCRPWICGQTPPSDCTAGQYGRISWLVDHMREHRTPPTSKGHGSGRPTTTTTKHIVQ